MTSGVALEILSWSAPPIIGALAGFFAARLAARMALRRLDLTGAVSRLTSGILASSLSSLHLPQGAITAQTLQRPALGALDRLISSPAFLGGVREAISRGVSSLCARTVKDALEACGISSFLTETVLPRLSEEESRKAIARSVASAAGARADQSKGDALGTAVSELIGPVVPTVIDRLVEGIKSEETRAVMAARGRELLPKILLRLNVLQRLLLSAGQFDRRIDEKMPEIMEDTVEAIEQVLRDPSQQEMIRKKLTQGVRDWRESGKSSTQLAPAVEGFVDSLLSGLADPAARAGVVRRLEELLGGGGQTLGGALRARFGVRDDEAADALTNRVLSWFSRQETREALSCRLAEAASRFLQENAATGIGVLLGVDAAGKEKLDQVLAARAAALVGQGKAVGEQPLGDLRRWAGIFGAGLGLGLGLLEVLLGILSK